MCVHICIVYIRNEHVVRDVVKVSAILEPGTSRADVVGGALLIDFNQDRGILNVLSIPLIKGSEELKTIAGKTDNIQ